MKADFTRRTYRKRKHYRKVLMQQGRVQVDADWNEQVNIDQHYERLSLIDIIGKTGTRIDPDGGFKVVPVSSSTPGDFGITPGRYYVDGLICENDSDATQNNIPLDASQQPDLPPFPTPIFQIQFESVPQNGTDLINYILNLHSSLTSVQNIEQLQFTLDSTSTILTGTTPDSHKVTLTLTGGTGSAATGATLALDGKAQGDVFTATFHDSVHTLSAAATPLVGLPNVSALPTAQSGGYLVFLDVWNRLVTYLDDPYIADTALGGADTAVRDKLLWQVKVLYGVPNCPAGKQALDLLTPSPLGSLQARARPTQPSSEPCELPPEAGYQGLEFQLYRVEIHDPGGLGSATFKWSRDNGTVVANVLGIDELDSTHTQLIVSSTGRDTENLSFQPNEWVEITDDAHDLWGLPGVFVLLNGVDPATNSLTFDPTTASGSYQVNSANFVTTTDADGTVHFPKVRRWDNDPTSGGPLTVKSDPSTDYGYIPLENGVEVSFGPGNYQTGDYWLIRASPATSDVEWPVAYYQIDFEQLPTNYATLTGFLKDAFGITWTIDGPPTLDALKTTATFSMTDSSSKSHPFSIALNNDGNLATLFIDGNVTYAFRVQAQGDHVLQGKVPKALGRLGIEHHYAPLAVIDYGASSTSAGAASSSASSADMVMVAQPSYAYVLADAATLPVDTAQPGVTISDCRSFFAALTDMIDFYYAGGDGQQASPQGLLAAPLEAGVALDGVPMAGMTVQFTITTWGSSSTGAVTASPPSGAAAPSPQQSVNIQTGTDGIARCYWTLDPSIQAQQGLLVQTVEAALLDASGNPINAPSLFYDATVPTNFFYVSGDGQQASPGSTINLAAGVLVGGVQPSPTGGVKYAVQFAVTAGGGTLNNTGTQTVTITPASSGNFPSTGIASCAWTLDSTNAAQQVEATLLTSSDGVSWLPSTLQPVYFNAYPATAGSTATSGVIGIPLPITKPTVFGPFPHGLKAIATPPGIMLGCVALGLNSTLIPKDLLKDPPSVWFMIEDAYSWMAVDSLRAYLLKLNMEFPYLLAGRVDESNFYILATPVSQVTSLAAMTAPTTTAVGLTAAGAPFVTVYLRWWAVPGQDAKLPNIYVTPPQTTPDSAVSVYGYTFSGIKSVILYSDPGLTKPVQGLSVQPIYPPGAALTTDRNGMFVCRFTAPSAGNYWVGATDGSGNTISAPLVVSSSGTFGPSGMFKMPTLSQFEKLLAQPLAAAVVAPQPSTAAAVIARPQPPTTAAAGAVSAGTVGGGATTLARAVAAPAQPPKITFKKATGPAGSPMTVNGAGFPPKSAVQLTHDNQALRTVRTDAKGAFVTSVTPLKPGTHTVTASVPSTGATSSATYKAT